MAGFVIQSGKVALRIGAKYLFTEGKRQIHNIPKYVKPAADFTRGVVKNGPKHIPIGGQSTGTTATISASLRAGMQTRYLATEATKAVIFKGPQGAMAGVKYIGYLAAKDVTRHYDYAYFGFKALTAGRRARFLSSGIERTLDKVFHTGNKYLNQLGLGPSLSGMVGATARAGALHYLSKGVSSAGDAVDEIHTTAKKYLRTADDAGRSFISDSLPAGTANPSPALPLGNAPAVPVAPSAPPAPAGPPPRPPVPTAPPRRYIPQGRQ